MLDRASDVADRFSGWVTNVLQRVPILNRLAPYLGIGQTVRFGRWLTLGALLLPGLLGLYPSVFGHIDTTPFIYQIMPILSYFSPVLGILGGIAFGVGDLIEKMFTNNIYYMGATGIGDYLGARVGYILSYSAVIVAGVLPGVLARIFQRFARRFFPRPMDARSGGGMGVLAGGIPWVELIAGAFGGMLGGGISGALAIPLEFPAFYLRPNPDVSCYASAIGNLKRLIPSMTASGGIGPVVDAFSKVTTSGSGGRAGGAPASPAKSPATPKYDRVPTTDRIYDNESKRGPWRQDAADILKKAGIDQKLKDLKPNDPKYWEKFDQILKGQKGNHIVKAITWDPVKDPNMKDVVVVVREPEWKVPPPKQPVPPVKSKPGPSIKKPGPAPISSKSPAPKKPDVPKDTPKKAPPKPPPPPPQPPIRYDPPVGKNPPMPSWGSGGDKKKFDKKLKDTFKKKDVLQQLRDGIKSINPKDWYDDPWKLLKVPFDAYKIARDGKEAIRDATRESMLDLAREAHNLRSQPQSPDSQKRLTEIRQSRRRLEERMKRLQ